MGSAARPAGAPASGRHVARARRPAVGPSAPGKPAGVCGIHRVPRVARAPTIRGGRSTVPRSILCAHGPVATAVAVEGTTHTVVSGPDWALTVRRPGGQ